jgi:hypothetical protein
VYTVSLLLGFDRAGEQATLIKLSYSQTWDLREFRLTLITRTGGHQQEAHPYRRMSSTLAFNGGPSGPR